MEERTFEISIEKESIFLSLIYKRLLGGRFIPNIKNNLESIQKSKTLTLDNIQDFFKYLYNAEYSNTYYFDSIRDLILNDRMDPDHAFSFLEDIKAENDYMMSIMCKYISELDPKQVAKEVRS